MNYILILGANSDIAKAVASEYAKHGHYLYLAARNSKSLDGFANDLQIRYTIKATPIEFNAIQYDKHHVFYKNLPVKPIGVVCAIGYLGDQKKAQSKFSEVQEIIQANFVGNVSILNIIANDFEQTKAGFIIGISSVAGERGRKNNYFYASAKAAFSCYLSGLRNRLYTNNVQVLTVKPGFVETKMTGKMNLPKILTAQPEAVAKDIYNAQIKGKNIIYSKRIWYFIMKIIKSIPEFQFKKMEF